MDVREFGRPGFCLRSAEDRHMCLEGVAFNVVLKRHNRELVSTRQQDRAI